MFARSLDFDLRDCVRLMMMDAARRCLCLCSFKEPGQGPDEVTWYEAIVRSKKGAGNCNNGVSGLFPYCSVLLLVLDVLAW